MNRRIVLLLAFPVATFLALGVLGLLSFLEAAGPDAEGQKPASAVRTNDTAETAAFAERREKARADVTAQSLLAELGPDKAAEMPSSAALIASFRSLVKKDPASADAMLEGLLGLWKEASKAAKAEARLALIEELLAQALLCATPDLKADAAMRADLRALFGATARKGSPAAAATLLLLARVGEPEDAGALEKLLPITADAQLKLEVAKAAAALRAAPRREAR